MALSNTLLSTELQAVLQPALGVIDAAQLKKFCDAVAGAVVNHIKNNAEVSGTCTGATLAGSPGGPLAIQDQPVTGTIS